MMLRKHSLIILSGCIWFFIGTILLIKGLYLLLAVAHFSGGPLLNAIMIFFTGALIPSLIFLVVVGLFLGWVKAHFALGKAAKRTIERLYPLKGPIRVTKLYRMHDYLLIVGMIGLGRLMHWMEVPTDIHGVFDVTIGSALINGAMVYFRFAIKNREHRYTIREK